MTEGLRPVGNRPSVQIKSALCFNTQGMLNINVPMSVGYEDDGH